VGCCDFDLRQYLITGQKNNEKEKLIRSYQQPLKSASDLGRDSIVKQIEFGTKSIREDVEAMFATLDNFLGCTTSYVLLGDKLVTWKV
jgi:hypothetical protein